MVILYLSAVRPCDQLQVPTLQVCDAERQLDLIVFITCGRHIDRETHKASSEKAAEVQKSARSGVYPKAW